MSCFKEQMIFDLIQDELDEETRKQVQMHLVSCERCLRSYEKFCNDLKIVRENIERLTAPTLPETPIISFKTERRRFHQKFLIDIKKTKIKIKFGFAVVIVCCIATFSLIKQKQQIDKEVLVAKIIATEEFFDSDQIKNGGFFWSIYNKEENNIQIIRMDRNAKDAVIKTINLSDFKQQGG